MKLLKVFGAFLVYFFSFVLPPLLYLLWAAFTGKRVDVTTEFIALNQIAVVFSFTMGMTLYLLALKRPLVQEVFGPISWKAFLMGMGWCILVVPVVFLVKEGLHHLLHTPDLLEQSMALILKTLLKHKELFIFGLLSFCVIFLGPIVEEILFRGFLQTYIQSKWGKKAAILGTSILFTALHFEWKMGIGNIELLVPLFLTGLALSALRAKYNTLFAPIGFHLLFNAFGIINVFSYSSS